MAGVASTLPVLESTTAIFLPSQTGKRRLAGDVEGQAGGRIAAGGPLGGELVGVGVEAHDFAFVFDVVEDGAVAVDGGELGLAGQGDGGERLSAWRRR